MRSGSPTRSTTAWSAASTTTPARRSSSPPTPSTRAQNGIGGGGRYDGLVELLGGDPTPGIGFGIGIERVLLACDAEGVCSTSAAVAARPLHAYVIDTAGGDTALALTAELRRAGLRADRAFDGRSMKSQIKSADRSGALVALVVGPQELGEGTVGLRPLRSDDEQRTVPRAAIVDELKSYLANAAFAEGDDNDVDRHLHPHLRPDADTDLDSETDVETRHRPTRQRHDTGTEMTSELEPHHEENRPTAMRTHLCGVLTKADVGTTVRLCGWVARRREHGEHLAFVDLRDHSGHRAVRHRPRHRRAPRVGDRRDRHRPGAARRAP